MDRDFAASSYLALRWVARPAAWSPLMSAPSPPADDVGESRRVRDATELIDAVAELAGTWDARTGLLLSGGMDSAILASFLAPGSHVYTIRFAAPGAVDESVQAASYARQQSLVHHVVDVDWATYESAMDDLMIAKCAPLHPVEVGLHAAALAARADGIDTLVVGNGADSNFGGLDQLLGREWALDAFIDRYTFVDPGRVLARPTSMRELFVPFVGDDGLVDVASFLNAVHGPGITQAFGNAIGFAGLAIETPYESILPAFPLDLARIRGGDSKYLVREAFRKLYSTMSAPDKIAFARPMDHWMRDWTGPRHELFRADLDVAPLTGEQRFLIASLDRFLGLLDDDATLPERHD